MSNPNQEKLKNQIWTTRTSRVNAEKRLQEKEAFIEGINIYYSCFTVIVSIFMMYLEGNMYDILSLAMSVVLTISILYFKTLNYASIAARYKENYILLQNLEFELSHLMTDSQVRDVERRYCEALKAVENHISYDYYKTIMQSSGAYRKDKLTNTIVIKYFWGCSWRFAVKCIVILLPLMLSLLAYWGEKNGWISSISSMETGIY